MPGGGWTLKPRWRCSPMMPCSWPTPRPNRCAAAIRKLWSYYMGLFASYACEVHHMLASDRLVFTERTERIARVDGQQVVLPVASAYELDDSGKIIAWRDYWDPAMANA